MNKNFWPNNKTFAFTIIDDTDNSTLDNAPIIYDYLFSKDIITTKSVWVRKGANDLFYDSVNGSTLEDLNYKKWVESLHKKGFEICLHSTSWSASKRSEVINGINFFENIFGRSKILVQHNDIKENESLYWGSNRLVFPLSYIFDFISLFYRRRINSKIYQGHNPKSIFYWGDICLKKIDYVRNLVFPTINLFNITKDVLHIRKSTKYIKSWFISTQAPNLKSFLKIVNKSNIDRLEDENGVCIIYTHFGNGFVNNGELNEDFKNIINYISSKNGWFVPASEILDYIKLKNKGIINKLSYYEELKLGLKWLGWKIFVGSS